MNTGIYQVRNRVNGKVYIGSAVNLKARRHSHQGALNRGTHHNNHFQSAWRKYGPDAFEWRILLICSRDDLMFYEQRAINTFDAVKNGYNKCPIAGKTIGRVVNPEVVKKMAATKRGVPMTPEAKAIHKAAMNRPEVRARLSASKKGKPKTTPVSEAHRAALSASQIGKTISPETRAKLRAANLGKKNGPHSEETRRKIALGQHRNPRSLESRQIAALKSWETRRRNMAQRAA